MKTKSTKFSDDVSNLTNLPTYQAGVAQASAYRALKKFTEAAVKEHGITSTQWFIIGSIYDAGSDGVAVTQLSSLLDTNVPYITNTLNVLASKNIIVRTSHGGDSRKKLVTIHPSFYNRVDMIEQDLRAKLQKALYTSVTPEELLSYIKVLHKMNSGLLEP